MNSNKNTNSNQTRAKILNLVSADFNILRGEPYPFGANIKRNGINFAIFSSSAKTLSIVIFNLDGTELLMEFPLDERYNRTGFVWHALIEGLNPGISYGYRVECIDGLDPIRQPCNNRIILFDPYAKATCGGHLWGDPLKTTRDGLQHTFRLSQVKESTFDWGLDQPLNIPLKDSIIYEIHVRGFTKHSSSNITHPGTFLGLTEKIPYLKELGITAVELMPVTDYDEMENYFSNPETGEKLKNFWGYDPLSFFAPKASYAFNNQHGAQVEEFKQMVRAFHKAGIEVILDMVFNHTGEGGKNGPVYHFKGLDNAIYYILDSKDNSYLNFSGCGNTLNCNHPVLREMIIQSLRYWVTEMHVDGFRFDLASILGRGRDGNALANPPILERIADDPILAKTKLIAEAWDAAGLYQVGDFTYGRRWMEWNGKFRDDVRNFLKGEPGMVPKLATRLSGSSDLYQDDGREPYHSVNFITCHDGFTLNDLVSYNAKHNQQNGENNRDGSEFNLSWNCGSEGETDNKKVNVLRERQIRNFAAILLLSQGVPMLLGGDEFRRTQKGNNNAYCQDNEISWFDWTLREKNSDLFRFFKLLIQFRKNHPNLRRTHFEVRDNNGVPEMSWHGLKLNAPDWSDESSTLAVHYSKNPEYKDIDIFIMLNSGKKGRIFELPQLPAGKEWFRVMDTSLSSPDDICGPGQEIKCVKQSGYRVAENSTVMLIGK
jgi:isoamylase